MQDELGSEIQSQREIRDAQARGYEERYLERGPTFISLDDKLMLNLPGFAAAHRVLDAGCGVGYFTRRIAPQVAHVDALDFSEESLRVLRERAAAANLKNITAVQGDLTRALPYADQSFDRIISYQVLSYLPPQTLPGTFKEFHRVLKPGGKALFSLFRFGPRGHFRDRRQDTVAGFNRYGYTAEDVREMLRPCEFSNIRLRGFVNSPARVRAWGDASRILRPLIVSLDAGLTRLPVSLHTGHYILVEVTR